MKKFALKFILFCMLIAGALWCASDFMADNFRKSNDAFYRMRENSVDVIFVGSSHCYHGFMPKLLEENFGISAFVLGSPNQTMLANYLWMKEAYKTQKFKLLVVEPMSFHTVGTEDMVTNIQSLYSMRPSLNYFSYIPYAGWKNAYKVVFPVFVFHNEWEEIGQAAFSHQVSAEELQNRGFFAIKEDSQAGKDALPALKEDTDEEEKLDFEFADKIRTFCEENEITLIFVKAVQTENEGNRWDDISHNGLEAYCERYGVPFVDFNTRYYREKAELDVTKDVAADLRHANERGAQKETLYLGREVLQKYLTP